MYGNVESVLPGIPVHEDLKTQVYTNDCYTRGWDTGVDIYSRHSPSILTYALRVSVTRRQ